MVIRTSADKIEGGDDASEPSPPSTTDRMYILSRNDSLSPRLEEEPSLDRVRV